MSEMETVMSWSMAALAKSRQCQHASGTPVVASSSHARDLIATTASGRGSRGTSAAGLFFQAGQAVLVEPFAPLGHHLAWGVEPGADGGVVEAVGGHQHNPGPHNITIR